MKYRLYIDEVGNPDLSSSKDPNHRYLSLTGLIFDLAYVEERVFPDVERLKRRYFKSHPDDPVILHRKELVNREAPFDSLRDSNLEQSFNADILHLLHDLEYTVVTVVIDKAEHLKRYQSWRFDPYHYCLTVLVERYVHWLRGRFGQGDVMAESRGGKEDRRLKDSFERLYGRGSDFMGPEVLKERLTSKQLKVKAKSNNVAGLQLADLIAHPSYRAMLARRQRHSLPQNFGGRIAKILEDNKYDRSPTGKIEGWGTKWLP